MGGVMSELGSYAPVGATGLLVLAVILIFRGALVPRLYYDEMRASRDEWRRAAERTTDSIDELLSQQRELLEGNLTTQRMIEAIKPPPPGG